MLKHEIFFKLAATVILILVSASREMEAAVYSTETWRTVEITLTSTSSYTNPFMDVGITATFTGPDNTVITRPGFWDGGDTWKVRFAPTKPGTWLFNVACTDTGNAGLHNRSDTVQCSAYSGELDIYKHGFLKVSTNKRYLVYDDGDPFFYLGDTHWFMEWEDYDNVFVPMVDRRLEQKYTVYQSHPNRTTLSNEGGTEIDPASYQSLDRYFRYLADMGMVHSL